MLATAALMAAMPVSTTLGWLVAVPMIVSAYAFCISTPLAAITGERGLQSGGQEWGQLVYAFNMVGAVGQLVFALVFMYAAGLVL